MENRFDHCEDNDPEFPEMLRRGLRRTVVAISLLSTRDVEGRFCGMAVTAAIPFSVDKPSIIVAVNHDASVFPVVQSTGIFCLNQITRNDLDLLDRFSRSDLRASRFTSNNWRVGHRNLPYLTSAETNFFCRVQSAQKHGDQTVFIAGIEAVQVKDDDVQKCDPLIWINGGPARLAN
ncbi:MAG: flavin reductase (DIM6/NTAB) family NADH-FMN oxidoreductase RutF [Celeribacter sp.]|jgi:flavin reductase (DIM6/NTAB) family NADH-FMN oxidoreductase RutF